MTERRAIGEVPIPETPMFSIKLREPGIVRRAMYRRSERLVMQAGAPAFEDRLVLFVESDPEGEFRDRRFAIMRPGQTIGSDDWQPVYVDTAFDSNGAPAHLYEVTKVKL